MFGPLTPVVYVFAPIGAVVLLLVIAVKFHRFLHWLDDLK